MGLFVRDVTARRYVAIKRMPRRYIGGHVIPLGCTSPMPHHVVSMNFD
jgi:hypothetical protein